MSSGLNTFIIELWHSWWILIWQLLQPYSKSELTCLSTVVCIDMSLHTELQGLGQVFHTTTKQNQATTPRIICQILTMTRGILLLQSNWIHYTSCWIFLHMIMRVYFIKADTNKLEKRLSLLMLFLLHLCSAKLNLAKVEAFIQIQGIMIHQGWL